ncbi:MAG: DNA polymerase III subunit delta [Bradymonadaceae bacterium]
MSKQADKARDFFRNLSPENLAGVYFVHGQETYLLDKAVEAILAAAAPDGLNDFNYDVFHGKSASGDQIRQAVEMLPMMTRRRIVLVRNFQEVPTSEWDTLKDYLDNPSPTTCLIIHARTADKGLDGRNSFVKKLKSVAETCEFKSLYENEVGSFISKQAGKRGLRLDSQAEAYLVEAVGTDLAGIDTALEKVDLYVGADPEGNRRMVDVSQVQAVVANTKVRSVFDLTDALGKRDFQSALLVLERMLLAGEPPILIAHMITRHFRILAKLNDPSLRNADAKTAAAALRQSPWFMRDYQRQARAFSLDETMRILEAMLAIDTALKSSRLPERVLMEKLLHAICFRQPLELNQG